MSNRPQQQQYQQEISIEHNLTSENNPFSTSSITISSTVNDSYSQQLQETNVTVNLYDCMKCYIRIPQCQVEDQNNSCNTNTENVFNHQLEVVREELDQYSNKGTQTDLDDQIQEFYGAQLDMDDFNFMETYLYIDLPWPEKL